MTDFDTLLQNLPEQTPEERRRIRWWVVFCTMSFDPVDAILLYRSRTGGSSEVSALQRPALAPGETGCEPAPVHPLRRPKVIAPLDRPSKPRASSCAPRRRRILRGEDPLSLEERERLRTLPMAASRL